MGLKMRAGEEGALLCRFIADGNHEVHWGLIGKLFDAFCTVACGFTEGDTHFGHRPDGKRMHTCGMRARAEDGVALTTPGAQQTLGHLRARRIVRAEKENTLRAGLWSAPGPWLLRLVLLCHTAVSLLGGVLLDSFL